MKYLIKFIGYIIASIIILSAVIIERLLKVLYIFFYNFLWNLNLKKKHFKIFSTYEVFIPFIFGDYTDTCDSFIGCFKRNGILFPKVPDSYKKCNH